MREIKFKVLDKSSQEFISDDGLTLKEIQSISNIDHFKLMQYTGLDDKNGKPIFEGDIITSLESGLHEKWAKKEAVVFDDKYCGYAPFCYPRFYN